MKKTFLPYAPAGATPLVLGALLSLLGSARCFAADEAAPPSDDDKVEACVQQLREAPASPSMDLQIGGERYQRLRVGDKAMSEQFTKCLDAASGTGFSRSMYAEVDNFSYGTRDRDDEWIPHYAHDHKYIFVDAYQRKYVLDVPARRSYDLVRIPVPGSIEAMGTWTGTVTPSEGCKNSYGDPCGSKYEKSRAGYSLIK